MTQADRVHSTPRTTAPKPNPPGDDDLGMAWWNALTEQERAKWSAIAGNTGSAKDAWEAFKRTSRVESAGALYRRTDISPEDFFQALGRVRRAARDEIERLIDWLDSTIDDDQDAAVDDGPCDGDTDAEPSLGSFDRMSNQIKAWDHRGWGDVDMEIDRCDDEDSDPAERSEQPAQMAQVAGKAVRS